MLHLLDDPDKVRHHLRRNAGAREQVYGGRADREGNNGTLILLAEGIEGAKKRKICRIVVRWNGILRGIDREIRLEPLGGRSGERWKGRERSDELNGKKGGRVEVGEEEDAVLKDDG